MKKQYIVRKYIMAENLAEVIRVERRTRIDEAWIDEEWRKANPDLVNKKIGFKK